MGVKLHEHHDWTSADIKHTELVHLHPREREVHLVIDFDDICLSEDGSRDWTHDTITLTSFEGVKVQYI